MINFDFEFTSEDGQPVYLSQGETKTPLTLRMAAIKALLYPQKNDNIGYKEKKKRYQIAVKLQEKMVLHTFDDSELQIIKEAMGAVYIPIVVGQACDILEGKEPSKFSL